MKIGSMIVDKVTGLSGKLRYFYEAETGIIAVIYQENPDLPDEIPLENIMKGGK